MTKKEQEALENATPKPPRVHELGGGIYYTCYWLACGNTVHPWDRYCSRCGQRLYWGKEDDERYIVKDGVLKEIEGWQL